MSRSASRRVMATILPSACLYLAHIRYKRSAPLLRASHVFGTTRTARPDPDKAERPERSDSRRSETCPFDRLVPCIEFCRSQCFSFDSHQSFRPRLHECLPPDRLTPIPPARRGCRGIQHIDVDRVSDDPHDLYCPKSARITDPPHLAGFNGCTCSHKSPALIRSIAANCRSRVSGSI